MEGLHSSENPNQQKEIAIGFKKQLEGFEASRNGEGYRNVPDALFGFAEYTRTQSSGVYEWVKTLGKYELEKEAAKLHEFNLANAAVLHRYAELLNSYPESVKALEDRFPWLREIAVWAERQVIKPEESHSE